MPTPPLRIGLVNNMPDGAFRATDRQFTGLLYEAAAGAPFQIQRYLLPEITRGTAVVNDLRAYRSINELFADQLDGLVVTGSEPRTARLNDEAYWPSFQRLVDWAQDCTRSTIWSCLAAHGAVLHLHGIERRRLERKLSGVFTRTSLSGAGHRLGMQSGSSVPHSRLNTLPSGELAHGGYRVIATIEGDDVDAFELDAGSRFLFLQGHPEYEAETLGLEYERDLRRYREGRRRAPPDRPLNYTGKAEWRGAAVELYRRWLQGLSAEALYSAA